MRRHFILLQAITPIIETAKDLSALDTITLISVVAVLAVFGLYRLAIYHHKQMIKEKSKENELLIKNLEMCRNENKHLKDQIVEYLIKAAQSNN